MNLSSMIEQQALRMQRGQWMMSPLTSVSLLMQSLTAPLEPDGGGMDWVASSKKDQREAGQVKQPVVWNLHDSHLWKACLRRQYWDWQCSEIISDLVEKDILSTRSEIMACWGREPLICWRVRIPPRGTWTDWRNGKTETSRSYD